MKIKPNSPDLTPLAERIQSIANGEDCAAFEGLDDQDIAKYVLPLAVHYLAKRREAEALADWAVEHAKTRCRCCNMPRADCVCGQPMAVNQ